MKTPLVILLLALAAAPARAEVSFVREVAPVLLKRCAGCHGDRANLGGYRAQTFQNLLHAGASGAAPVTAGKPEQSQLFRLITAASPQKRMPKGDDPLPKPEVEVIRRWIAEGAKFDGPDRSAPFKSLLGPREHPLAPAVYRAAVPVLALAFSPDGKELLAGGYHEVTVWNPATGALVRRIQRLPERIQALSFSPDGKQLLVAGGTPGDYGEVALVDPASGARTVLDTFPDIVLAAAFSADGKLLAAGSAGAGVRLYETATRKRLWSTKVHSDWVSSVSFSPDAHFLASASKDMTVKVYEVKTGALFTTYGGHNRQIGKYRGASPVWAVRFLPQGGEVMSVGGGQWVQFWDPVKARAESGDAGDMEERFAKQGHARYLEHGFAKDVYTLALRDGQLFAGSADGTVKQFDLAQMKEVRRFPGAGDWVFSLTVSADRVAAGSYDGTIRLWDTKSGELLQQFAARPR